MTRVRLTQDHPVPPEMLEAVMKAEVVTISYPGGKITAKGAGLRPETSIEVEDFNEFQEIIADAGADPDKHVREIDCLDMRVGDEQLAIAVATWIESLEAH